MPTQHTFIKVTCFALVTGDDCLVTESIISKALNGVQLNKIDPVPKICIHNALPWTVHSGLLLCDRIEVPAKDAYFTENIGFYTLIACVKGGSLFVRQECVNLVKPEFASPNQMDSFLIAIGS